MSGPDKWSDLGTRLLSGIVVLVLGIGAIWQGGLALYLLALAVAGLGIWELVRLTDPAPSARPVLIGLVAAGASLMLRFWALAPKG